MEGNKKENVKAEKKEVREETRKEENEDQSLNSSSFSTRCVTWNPSLNLSEARLFSSAKWVHNSC